MKYRSRSIQVNVEVYEKNKGLEDGFSCNGDEIGGCELPCEIGGCPRFQPYVHKNINIDTRDGYKDKNHIHVKEGDYIVTNQDGYRKVFKESQFHAIFEKID